MTCKKDCGECVRCRGPQYVGCTERPLKTRFSEHLGSVTQPSQVNTSKPVGVHFRSAGHSHADMVVQPIEKVRSQDQFVLEARERFWIRKYQTVKTQAVEVVEHGLNLKWKYGHYLAVRQKILLIADFFLKESYHHTRGLAILAPQCLCYWPDSCLFTFVICLTSPNIRTYYVNFRLENGIYLYRNILSALIFINVWPLTDYLLWVEMPASWANSIFIGNHQTAQK